MQPDTYTIMTVVIYNPVATVTLTSTLDGRQAACPGEVTYSCNVTQGFSVSWTAAPVLVSLTFVRLLPSGPRMLRCSDIQAIQCADLDFQANLTVTSTVVNGMADLTSTFRFTARVELNETVVECSGLTLPLTPPVNHTFTVAGKLYYCR